MRGPPTSLPDPPEPSCEICRRSVEQCLCSECPVCGTAGDPKCATEHAGSARAKLARHDPELVLFDDLDDAAIGVGYRHATGEPFVVYSRPKCIDAFVKQGMTYEEACEYFEFNVACAYVGPRTPAFVTPIEDLE